MVAIIGHYVMQCSARLSIFADFIDKKYLTKSAANSVGSPAELVKIISTDPSVGAHDVSIEVYDLFQSLYKDIQKFKPKNYTESKKAIHEISDWTKNVYEPYVKAIESINIKQLMSNEWQQWFSVSDSYQIYKSLLDIVDLKKYIQGIKDKAEELLHKHHYGGQLYIRFGKYPKSERSRMGLGEEWEKELGGKTHESGVSVYRTQLQNGKWLLIDSNADKAMYNYQGFTFKIFEDAIKHGHIYLVTGKQLTDVGADGDTLLTDIFPIKTLSPDDIVFDSGKTLTDVISSVHEFRGFKHPAGKMRDLLSGIDLLINQYEASKLSDEDDKFLESLVEKTDYFKQLEKLTDAEQTLLLLLIGKIKRQKNKELVFKGYRPFY